MSGAEPCTGSYSALRLPVLASGAPSEAEGSMPMEPVSMAASSESMSPNRLSQTMTSNCLGVAHELHGAGVGQDVLQLDVLDLPGVHGGDDLVPQHAGAHDVALLGRVHLVLALAGEVEGDAGDALDLARGVDGGVDGALLAVLQRDDLLGLAEVGAAGQLAQDQDVEAFDVLAPERGGFGERGIADGGTQVGEQVEVLAQAQQAGLGAVLVGDLVPLRPADGAEHDGIGGFRLGQRLAVERHAVLVDGRAADQAGLGLELRPCPSC